MSETVMLRTGIEARKGTVASVIIALETMMDDGAEGALLVYDLLSKCRDPNYRHFGNNGQELYRRGLAESDGSIHQAIKEIVLACFEGEGINARLVSPVSGK